MKSGKLTVSVTSGTCYLILGYRPVQNGSRYDTVENGLSHYAPVYEQ